MFIKRNTVKERVCFQIWFYSFDGIFRALLFYLFLVKSIPYITAEDVSYFQIPGDRCSWSDTCDRMDFLRACSCNDDCYRYGICCYDASNFNLMKKAEPFVCYSKGIKQPTFVKKMCSQSFSGSSILKESCENSTGSLEDLMNNVLVSSKVTKINYWNWNCAICNNEDVSQLNFWTVQVSCTSDSIESRHDQSYIQQNITYNKDMNAWGVYRHQKFVNCSLNFHQPEFLAPKLQTCEPNIVSNCPKDWKDDETRKKCLAYYGERKHKDSNFYYRNVHCALCNGLQLEDLLCDGRTSEFSFPKTDMYTTRVFFNLNPNSKHYNSEMTCSQTQRYDPFLKICRGINKGLRFPPEEYNESNSAVLRDFNFFSTFVTLLFLHILKRLSSTVLYL